MSEYPKMIYCDGAEIDVNGIQVNTLIVHNADEELAALGDGWRVALVPTVTETPAAVKPTKALATR